MVGAKFPIVIAGIVAVMAALMLIPNINRQGGSSDQTELTIDYSRQHLVRNDAGVLAATEVETLRIRNDGAATYTRINPQGTTEEDEFSLSSEERSRIRGLILETGFMQIPVEQYQQRAGLANLTKYTLTASAGEESKTITWVNQNAYDDTIPPLIANVGTQLDDMIARRA